MNHIPVDVHVMYTTYADYAECKSPDITMFNLEICTERLWGVVRRMSDLQECPISLENAARIFDDLQYHGEAFLNTAFQFREHLMFLFAMLTNKDKRGITEDRQYREEAWKELGAKSPASAIAIEQMLERLRWLIDIRNKMTHGTFVHLQVSLVDPKPDANGNRNLTLIDEDTLLQVADDHNRFINIRRVINSAIVSFVEECEADVQSIRTHLSNLRNALADNGRLTNGNGLRR
jgi:hypothetical protein